MVGNMVGALTVVGIVVLIIVVLWACVERTMKIGGQAGFDYELDDVLASGEMTAGGNKENK